MVSMDAETALNGAEAPNVDVLPDGRCIPAISDDALWTLAAGLHSNVPEDKRPMGWSDYSPEQVQRLRQSALAFLAALPPPLSPAHIQVIVTEAMQDTWNDICSDTDCHPLDIEHVGRRRLTFHIGHWARQTGARVAAAICPGSSHG